MTAISFNANWRPGDNFQVAKAVKSMFAGFLPEGCLETALATCRFCFQGPKSVGKTGKPKNWGHWVRTRMQSAGIFPDGFGQNWRFAVQREGRDWISFDCHQIASDILAFVGITINDVYDKYGKPGQGEKYIVDLATIIREIAPDCLSDMPTTATAVA